MLDLLRLALAGALALAALPALADQPAQVVVQVVPAGQQAPTAAAPAGQAGPGTPQTVRPEPVVEPGRVPDGTEGAKPPAQTVGVVGVPPKADQAK